MILRRRSVGAAAGRAPDAVEHVRGGGGVLRLASELPAPIGLPHVPRVHRGLLSLHLLPQGVADDPKMRD